MPPVTRVDPIYRERVKAVKGIIETRGWQVLKDMVREQALTAIDQTPENSATETVQMLYGTAKGIKIVLSLMERIENFKLDASQPPEATQPKEPQ